MKKRDEISYKITDSQLFTLIIGVVVGVGVTTLPREVAAEAGRDGWITILLAVLLGVLYMYICISYSKLFPNLSLVESMQVVLGKPLGIFLSILYVVHAFATAGIIFRLFIENNYVYFDLFLPLLLPVGVTTIIIVYIGRCGLATLARLSEIIFVFSFMFIFLFFFPGKEANFLNLRPVFQNGILPPVKGIPTTALALIGLEVILVFYPFLEQKKNAFRVSALALSVVGILYAGIFVGTVALLGLEATKIYTWPFTEYLKLISFQVADRIDSIFIYIWTAKVFLVTGIQYFAGTFSLAMLTKRKYHDIWVLVCCPIFFLVAYLPRDLVAVFDFADIVTIYGGVFVLALPIILLIIAKVRGLKLEETSN